MEAYGHLAPAEYARYFADVLAMAERRRVSWWDSYRAAFSRGDTAMTDELVKSIDEIQSCAHWLFVQSGLAVAPRFVRYKVLTDFYPPPFMACPFGQKRSRTVTTASAIRPKSAKRVKYNCRNGYRI